MEGATKVTTTTVHAVTYKDKNKSKKHRETGGKTVLAVSLISMKDLKYYFSNIKVTIHSIQLTTYCGTDLEVFGYAIVNVSYIHCVYT